PRRLEAPGRRVGGSLRHGARLGPRRVGGGDLPAESQGCSAPPHPPRPQPKGPRPQSRAPPPQAVHEPCAMSFHLPPQTDPQQPFTARALRHLSTNFACTLRSRDERPARTVYVPGGVTQVRADSSKRANARARNLTAASTVSPGSADTRAKPASVRTGRRGSSPGASR